MKKTLNQISALVPNNPNYKGVADKLNFDSFQGEAITQPKRTKVLRIVIPTASVCTLAIVAAIVVPITLNNHLNDQTNNHVIADMNPISDEMMSFYLENTSFNGSGDIAQGTSVGGLYNTYKQRPENMAELAQRKEIYTLSGENQFHCYYATKEVYDKVNEQLSFPPAYDSLVPYRHLTAYIDGYKNGNWSEELKSQQLMEITVPTNSNYVENKIEDYYLLDIVRLYQDSNIDNFSFIGFANHEVIEGNQASIKKDSLKDSFKYCSCTFTNPNKLTKKINYSYLSVLDYHSFEIEMENNIEVVKTTFAFDSRHADVNNDLTYYDDINECIIKKELLDSSNNYGYLYERYNVTIDYNKLMVLFGF